MIGRSALALVCTVAAVFAACTEDTTKYGDSNGLTGKHLPSPSSTGTAPPGGDGGITTTGPTLKDLCGGAGPLDGGTCAVTWTTTIYPKYIAAAGTWKCADANCHGPGSAQLPAISDKADKAYLQLATYKGSGLTGFANKLYINPCSIDPATSALACNLLGSCTPTMPVTGGSVSSAGATAAENADVDKWLKCGAPFN
jgi:hypothetical protein